MGLHGDDVGRTWSKRSQEPGGEGQRRLRLGSSTGGSRRDSSFPATPLGHTLEEATRRRQEMLAKAQAARALQLARQQEIRVGEEWSELLKVPSHRTPDVMLNFWEEVKLRLLKRFGSLHAAIQGAGESSVSFLKFCDLLRVIHFPLNQSTCRHLFGQVCGGHREMPVDSFKALLMERTIQSMRFVMEGWNGKQVRLQSHIRTFIRRLAEVDVGHRMQAVDRFQRKLSGPFLHDFWQLLLKRLGSSRSEDLTVTQSALLRVLVDPEATVVFQDHEVLYMLRVFERMASFRKSLGSTVLEEAALPLRYYLAGLVLISSISTKKEKLALIFEAFDSDYDHCLLYSQVHEMCHCICVLKVMVEESARGASDENFQSELSQQEGLRWYESIRWHLQRTGSVQGDIVSLPELFAALDAQPNLLLPGLVRFRWAAEAAPGEELEEALAAAAAELRQAVRGPTKRRPAVDLSKLTAATLKKGDDEEFLDWRSLELGKGGLHFCKSESYIFKSVLTSRFAKSLRELGNQRLEQLMQVSKVEEDHKRGGEAPAIALDLAPALTGAPGIARVSSAPSLVRSRRGPKDGDGSVHAAAVATLPKQRWGAEAGNRFRIYAAAKTGIDSQDLQHVRHRPDPGQIMPYKCKLCLRLHKLCPGHDILQ